jgi:hypothetical protein
MSAAISPGGPNSAANPGQPEGLAAANAVTRLPASFFSPPAQTTKVKVTVMARVFHTVAISAKEEKKKAAYNNLMVAFKTSIGAMASTTGLNSTGDIQFVSDAYNNQSGILKASLYIPKAAEKSLKDLLDDTNNLDLPKFGKVTAIIGDKEFSSSVLIKNVPHWWNNEHLKEALKTKDLDLLSVMRDTEPVTGLKCCSTWLGQMSSSSEIPESGKLRFTAEDATNTDSQPQEAGELLELIIHRTSNIPAYLLEEDPANERGFKISDYRRPIAKNA